jgi:transcriptional regulator with XRE-family HTH domain
MFDPERLAQVLRVQGRQVIWLADATEYDPSTISRYLKGSQPISERFALRAAKALGIPVDWLKASEQTSVAA